MRILQVNKSANMGGTERNILAYANGFTRRGHYVVTCCFAGKGDMQREFAKTELPFVSLPITSPRNVFNFYKFLQFVINNHFDVVQVYGIHVQVLVSFFLKKILKIPVLISGLRGTEETRKFYTVLIEKTTHPFIDGWIAVSNEVKRIFIKREGIPPDKLKVITNGLDTSRFTPEVMNARVAQRAIFGVADTTFAIGYVGNLRPYKGHEDLLYACQKLKRKNPDFKLFLVGVDYTGGQFTRMINNLVNELGLEDNVILTGYMSDVRKILPVFDLFILPSHQEGLSNAMLEAMAVGIPVIATRVGGTPEVIEDGKDGVFVPAKNPESLYLAIERLLNDPELRDELRTNAIMKIQQKFSFDSRIDEMLHYYQVLLNRS